MASWEVTDLVGLALSPDGKTVAVASFPVGGITFRDVGSGRARADLKPLPGGTSPMAFSPDGKRFVSVNRDRRAVATVTLMDLAAGRDLASYNHSGGHVHVAAFSPDGKLLASGDHDTGGSARLLLMEVPGSAPRKP
jgi:WD40 repeat protein